MNLWRLVLPPDKAEAAKNHYAGDHSNCPPALGCRDEQHSKAQQTPAPKRPKIETKVIQVSRGNFFDGVIRNRDQKLLDKLNSEGWRVIAVDSRRNLYTLERVTEV